MRWRCPSVGRRSLVERGRGGRLKRDRTKKGEGGVGNEKKKKKKEIGRGDYW